jgi:hypothetical protein
VSRPTDHLGALRALRLFGPLAAAALALSAAACTDYVERRETIAAHAGNAVAANRAIHIIDPWPAASADTGIETSGRRIADAIERYETRAAASAPAAPQIVAVPVAMPAPGGMSGAN